MGTPLCLSPGQAAGRVAEPASDLFALGVVLFELVTGRLPFQVRTGHTHLLRAVFVPVAGSAGAHVVEREPILVARAVPVLASLPGLSSFLE